MNEQVVLISPDGEVRHVEARPEVLVAERSLRLQLRRNNLARNRGVAHHQKPDPS